MAATTAGALKAFIESGGLSLAVYRDLAPSGATLPYVIIHEAISVVPSVANARYDRAGGAMAATETVQVSLWQRHRKLGDGTEGESYTLPDSVAALLDGAVLPATGSGAPPKHVWGVRLLNSVRLVDSDADLVHHAMTVEVVRDL